MKNYSKYLGKSKKTGRKQIVNQSIGLSVMYLTIYGLFGYSFFWGGYLRYNEVNNSQQGAYTGGAIFAIFLSVMMGALTFGGASPSFIAIAEGRAAGKIAFETIDHQPSIITDKPGSQKIYKKTVKGEFEFKDVKFKYPTRQDLKVLDNFSCIFEAGKTTAIVGPSGSGKSTVI